MAGRTEALWRWSSSGEPPFLPGCPLAHVVQAPESGKRHCFPKRAIPVVNQIVRQAKKALSGRRETLLRVLQQRGSDSEMTEVVLVLSEKEQRELEEVDAALARVADGSFGECQRCSRSIGRQRLLAIPEARCCLECSDARSSLR